MSDKKSAIDIEKPEPPTKQDRVPTTEDGRSHSPNEIVVDWDGPEDILNPKKFVRTPILLSGVYSQTQLVISEEMDFNCNCVAVHLSQPCFFLHDCTSYGASRPGVLSYKHSCYRNDDLNICACVW
jgi:hypothetical protein